MLTLKFFRNIIYPKMRVEGTANYAAMSKDLIENIVKLNPNMKAVVMVRNPVKRAWAHAKKDLLNESLINESRRELKNVTNLEIESFIKSSYQLSCCSYSTIINNWSSILKPNNLFIGFFDDISIKPESFLLDVFNFLGVSKDSKYISDKYRQKIAKTDSETDNRALPDHFENILNDLFSEEVEYIFREFGRTLTR